MDQLEESFSNFIAKSKQLGDIISDVARLTEQAFLAHVEIIKSASKPAQDKFNQISTIFQQVENFKQDQKRSDFYNHIAAIAESIPAFGWVAISPTPAPFVKEMTDAAQFYTNKVLVAFKDKDKRHVEWVQSWLEFLRELQKYIRQTHTTGLTWNGGTSSAPPPPPAPMMPPPPPPSVCKSQTDVDSDARIALLKDLNRGTDITKNLRKINLDPSGVQGRGASRSKTPEPRLTSASPSAGSITGGKPRFELEGRKWLVEYQDGSAQQDFTIDATQMNQVLNVYRCSSITITVKGKVNSITVDSCKNVKLAFEDIVAFVEFINCQKMQAYPVGKVATITVDKTDSIQLFLRPKSLDAEIITAKSSEINVCIVDEASGDYKEYPLPEQLKTVYSGQQFKTIAMPKA